MGGIKKMKNEKTIRIEDLSRTELLSLIYNNLKMTVFEDHPVFCATCSKGYNGDLVKVHHRIVVPRGYICDQCDRTDTE